MSLFLWVASISLNETVGFKSINKHCPLVETSAQLQRIDWVFWGLAPLPVNSETI